MTRAVCDLHVHTRHSCDSRASLETYCKEAIRTGVDSLCFTDHVDYNPNDYGYYGRRQRAGQGTHRLFRL